MSVSLRSFPSYEDCGICLEAMNGDDSIAHFDGGEKHPVHRGCLKEWIETKNTCPTCRAQVDVNCLLTWKDRVVTELKFIRNDALFAINVLSKIAKPFILAATGGAIVVVTGTGAGMPAGVGAAVGAGVAIVATAKEAARAIAVAGGTTVSRDTVATAEILGISVAVAAGLVTSIGLRTVTAEAGISEVLGVALQAAARKLREEEVLGTVLTGVLGAVAVAIIKGAAERCYNRV